MILRLLKRLSLIIPTLIGITLLVFLLLHLIPGDPVEALSGERGMSPERYARLLAEFGLDKPLWQQYLVYLRNIFQGNLGYSTISHEPVVREFFARFPATLELSVCAIVVAIGLGLPAGMIAAVKRNTFWDYSIMGASLTGYSMPIFWWGLLLILFFSVNLGLTPVSGRVSVIYDIPNVTGLMLIDSLLIEDEGAFWDVVKHLILPTIALATIPLAVIARMTRSAMLEVLREDYIRTARAKGAGTLRVIGLHALRNALIPVITVIGLQVGVLLTGAILTETIFSWPGIGKWLVEAIHRRDYPVIQGGILMTASMIILVNLLVDALYGVINPKVRT